MKIKIGFSFLAFNALLFMFRDSRLICGFYAACALHELGHVAAIQLTGGEISSVSLSCFGIRLAASPPKNLRDGVLVLLSGPAVNLLFWPILRRFSPLAMTARFCLAEGLFNLIPLSSLDGGAVLDLLTEGSIHEETYKKIRLILCVISALTIIALCVCTKCQ